MTRRALLFLYCGAALIFVWTQKGVGDVTYSGPDDPAVVAAAREAVASKRFVVMPVEEGNSFSFSEEVVSLVGIPDTPTGSGVEGIGGSSTGIEGLLEDLNAQKVGQQIKISLSGDVLFDFDKWDIKPEAEETLTKVAKAIKGMKVKKVLVEGHTDSKGSDQYNLMLSKLRAASVKSWLVNKGGVPTEIIETKGYGESRPIAPNTKPDGSDNPEGRAKNRRVEIYLTVVQ